MKRPSVQVAECAATEDGLLKRAEQVRQTFLETISIRRANFFKLPKIKALESERRTLNWERATG